MLDVVCNQFYNPSTQKIWYFLAHPLQTSLYRMRQKLLFNVVRRTQEDQFKNCFFISLSVSPEFYDSWVSDRVSFSKIIRKFLDFLKSRHKLKKPPLFSLQDFSQIWRIERGTKNTQRLHYHMIIWTNDTLERIRYNITRYWNYCKWEFMDLNDCFQVLTSEKMAAIYACKYSSKTVKKGEKGHIAEIKNEIVGRIWSSSRKLKPIPKSHHMVFDPDLQVWNFTLKENYGMDYDYQNDPIYVQRWKYEKIAIHTLSQLKDYNDFAVKFREMEQYDQEMRTLEDFDSEEITIPQDLQKFKENFCYENAKSIDRPVMKTIDDYSDPQCEYMDDLYRYKPYLETFATPNDEDTSLLGAIARNLSYLSMKSTDLYYI